MRTMLENSLNLNYLHYYLWKWRKPSESKMLDESTNYTAIHERFIILFRICKDFNNI